MIILMRIITIIAVFFIIIVGYYLLIEDLIEQMKELKKINISSQDKNKIIWGTFGLKFVFEFLFKKKTKEDRFNLLKDLINGNLQENEIIILKTAKSVVFVLGMTCGLLKINIQNNCDNSNLNQKIIEKSNDWNSICSVVYNKDGEEQQHEL